MRMPDETPTPPEPSSDRDPKGAAFAALMGKRIVKLALAMVALGLIAVVIALGLSNFNRMRTRAMEAQTKSNLHTIQIALERYAVDWDGLYPAFLLGGTPENNPMSPGTMKKAMAYWPSDQDASITVDLPPLAFNWELRPADWNWKKPLDGVPPKPENQLTINVKTQWADALISQGYLHEYPRNPFEPVGARVLGDNQRMLELSLGWGDGVILELEQPAGKARYGFKESIAVYPGNFFYHPYFCVGLPAIFHNIARLPTNSPTINSRPNFDVVCGYTLVAFGSSKDPGLDFTHAMTGRNPTMMSHPGILEGYPRPSRPTKTYLTGYMSYEPDPYGYWQARDEVGPENSSGPDGIPDHAILILTGGLDKKVITIPPLSDSGEPVTR